MCWKYCRLWFFPLNVFYWTPLNWGRLSFEMCPVKVAQIWSFFPLERDRPLGTSVGSSHWALSGRWGAAVAAGAYGDGSHQEQTSASWLWSWEWPDSVSHSQVALPSTWQFAVLAVRSAVPCFFPLKKVVEWKEASQRLLVLSHSKIVT